MDTFNLNERQSVILKLLVKEYIQNDQPVSSLYLFQKYQPGCSSATIRSIFKYLDDNGYVYSPHRSSGRIPTEKAFRYYVNHLESDNQIDDNEQKIIQAEYLKNGLRLIEILETTGRVLSMLTDYATIVLGPAPQESILKHIELIDMGQDEILVILVTRSGTLFSRTVYVENRIPGDYLHLISKRLNEMFKGMDLSDVRDKINHITTDDRIIQKYIPIIGKVIHDNFDAVQGEEKLIVHGLDNLFTHIASNHTFQPGSIKNIGELLESREFLSSMFEKPSKADDCQVLINGDIDFRLSGLSIVTAGYKMGDRQVGALGIVGPNRMDYNRVINLVEYVRILMSNMITRISN